MRKLILTMIFSVVLTACDTVPDESLPGGEELTETISIVSDTFQQNNTEEPYNLIIDASGSTINIGENNGILTLTLVGDNNLINIANNTTIDVFNVIGNDNSVITTQDANMAFDNVSGSGNLINPN